jgi:hypothetical protein
MSFEGTNVRTEKFELEVDGQGRRSYVLPFVQCSFSEDRLEAQFHDRRIPGAYPIPKVQNVVDGLQFKVTSHQLDNVHAQLPIPTQISPFTPATPP